MFIKVKSTCPITNIRHVAMNINHINFQLNITSESFSSQNHAHPMALQNPALDLQAWFEPIFATHREYSRSTELLCQLDDLSDYTDEMDLPAASHHLRLMRNHLEHVRTILRLRMTTQMIQLARRFRNHFRQQQRIPIVNLDFR